MLAISRTATLVMWHDVISAGSDGATIKGRSYASIGDHESVDICGDLADPGLLPPGRTAHGARPTRAAAAGQAST